MPYHHPQSELLNQIGDIDEDITRYKRDALAHETSAHIIQQRGYVVRESWHRKNAARNRPFVGWDGEGITYPGQQTQDYVLFGASTGATIYAPAGKRLTSQECFELMLAVEEENPDVIHAGYSIKYDANQWLADVPSYTLKQLYQYNQAKWEGYRLEYYPGKWFTVRRGKTTARIFDVFGYFQTSFINACMEFLGDADPLVEYIRAGKAARDSFQYDSLEGFIIPYWRAELDLLVRLMESLRKDLHTAGIYPSSWHGPGGIANVVFKQFNVQAAKAVCPEPVNEAARYAYAGGRFELFQAGHYPHPVWEYDIRSAYPSAIAGLPDLSKGHWEYTQSFQPGSYGVWHCYYAPGGSLFTRLSQAQPLFCRNRHGGISFPAGVEGWYWTPEAELCPEAVREGWVFHPDSDNKPFEFVQEYYNRRKQWKDEGNSAQKALKLALNSLYGKMAQHTGWQPGEPPPKWHQLEWAGYVTSLTRAKIYNVIHSAAPAGTIIATETDAIFSTCSLAGVLPISSKLGDWEETCFDGITYIQSGFYYAIQKDSGKILEKYRGFDKGSLPYWAVLDYLRNLLPEQGWSGELSPLFGDTKRFIGLGLGLRTSAVWRSWQQSARKVDFGGREKRTHVARYCPACRKGLSPAEALHPLVTDARPGRLETSYPYQLPWLDYYESNPWRLEKASEMW